MGTGAPSNPSASTTSRERPDWDPSGGGLGTEETAPSGAKGVKFCSTHVLITEGVRLHGSPLCPTKRTRERHLFVSRGHVVSVYFNQQYRKMPTSPLGMFILKIEGKCLSKTICIQHELL